MLERTGHLAIVERQAEVAETGSFPELDLRGGGSGGACCVYRAATHTRLGRHRMYGCVNSGSTALVLT